MLGYVLMYGIALTIADVHWNEWQWWFLNIIGYALYASGRTT